MKNGSTRDNDRPAGTGRGATDGSTGSTGGKGRRDEKKAEEISDVWRRQFSVCTVLYILPVPQCIGDHIPFFAGGTLLFFGYFTRKSESSSADGKTGQTKTHINKWFLMVCIVIAGILNATTDSGVLVFFNTMLMFVLVGVLLLQYWHDLTGWSVAAYIKGGMTMLSGVIASTITPIYDVTAWWQQRRMGSKAEKKEINEKVPGTDASSDQWGSG